jgi:hypothetical protein
VSNEKEYTRILGGVSAKERQNFSSNIGKKSLVWLLLGGVAITAAWGLINRTGSNAPTVDNFRPATTPPIAATAPSALAAPEAVLAAAPSAATIINVDEKPSNPAISDAKDSHQDPLANMLEAGVKIPSNTMSAVLDATPIDAPVKTHVAAQPAQRTEPVKVAAERSKSPQPPSHKSIDPIDNDVSLISALVAHTEVEPTPAPPPTKRAAKKPTQDIVERRTGDSTAALIKRCKRLGGTEAKLCQRRICAGHGSEAACKAK